MVQSDSCQLRALQWLVLRCFRLRRTDRPALEETLRRALSNALPHTRRCAHRSPVRRTDQQRMLQRCMWLPWQCDRSGVVYDPDHLAGDHVAVVQ